MGTDGASIARALAAADAHEEVVAIVGRHPHEAEGFGSADLDEIERAAIRPEVRAVGAHGRDPADADAPGSLHELRGGRLAGVEVAVGVDHAAGPASGH